MNKLNYLVSLKQDAKISIIVRASSEEEALSGVDKVQLPLLSLSIILAEDKAKYFDVTVEGVAQNDDNSSSVFLLDYTTKMRRNSDTGKLEPVITNRIHLNLQAVNQGLEEERNALAAKITRLLNEDLLRNLRNT